MNQLNTVIIEGNVVRKAERSEPAPGFKVCKFPLAINRYYKGDNGNVREDVSYVDVEVYGNYGDSVERNCTKGRGIRVVGRLKQDRWESGDGRKNSRIYVIAEHIEYKQIPANSTEFNKRNKDSDLSGIAAANTAALAEDAYRDAVGF